MKYLVITIAILMLTCTYQNKAELEVSQYFETTAKSITISNMKNIPIEFEFVINDKFPIDSSILYEQIHRLSKQKNIPFSKSAWMFISKNTFHYEPFNGVYWGANPSIFINSLGGGFCDQRAWILANTWKEFGFESRIQLLEGHVVPEVYDNEKWKMYDPDRRKYYLNTDGDVASVKEVSSEFSLISLGIENNLCFKDSLELNLYRSRENNTEITQNYSFLKFDKETFTLPKNSSLQIFKDTILELSFAVLTLSDSSKGIARVPLVPFKVVGATTILYKNEELVILDSLEINLGKTFEKESCEISIINCSGEVEIWYYINPFVNLWSKNNYLSINATDSLSVYSVSPSLLNRFNSPYSEGNYYMAVLDTLIDSDSCVGLISEMSPNYDYNQIETTFINYLKCSSIKENKIDSLVSELSQFYTAESELDSLIRLYHPKSTSNIFVSVKNERINLFKQYLNQSVN